MVIIGVTLTMIICTTLETYDTEYEEEDSFEALCRFESQATPVNQCVV